MSRRDGNPGFDLSKAIDEYKESKLSIKSFLSA